MKGFISVLMMLFYSAQLGAQTNQLAFVSTPFVAEHESFNIDEEFMASFTIHSGKVVIQAVLNGEQGNFLLDSGAESLLINGKVDELSQYEIKGLNGSTPASKILIQDLKIGQQEFFKVPAFQSDLTTLSNQMGIELQGIIGADFLKNGVIHLDYKNKILQFWPKIRSGELKEDGWNAIPLQQRGHLTAICLKINGKKVWMGLDTGAEINLLATNNQWRLNTSYGDQAVSGINGNEILANPIDIKAVTAKNNLVNTGTIYHANADLFLNNFDEELSGLLGFPFFSKNQIILDFKKGILYIK